MKKLLIKNAKGIVTCDTHDAYLKNGDIYIEDGEIKEIEYGLDVEGPDVEVIDASNAFVYPGLINTHHHMIQAFTRNIASLEFTKGITLFEWLTYCYQLWKKNNPEFLYHASLISMAEGLKYGCTSIFDQQYIYPAPGRKNLIDSQFEAAKDIGIRYHSGRSCMTMTEKDGGLPPDILGETTQEVIEDLDRVYHKYHEGNTFGMAQLIPAPCSPFSVKEETYREALAFARSHGLQFHSHLGEDDEEIEFMVERYGKRSLDWAMDFNMIGPDVWYAHGNYFNEEELKQIGQAGGGIAYCPMPQMILGAAILDIPMAEKFGVTISLGTDGQGVQDGSNMLEVVRNTYLLQCTARYLGREKAPTAYETLKKATVSGAKVLGRKDIGSLEVGKAADCFLVDCSSLEQVGALEDPMSYLAKVGYHKPVAYTIVNGQVVCRDGNLLTIDEREATRKATGAFKQFK